MQPMQQPDAPPPLSPFQSRVVPIMDRLSKLPYWALVALILSVFIAWFIFTDESYTEVFQVVIRGLWVTVWVTAVSYTAAVLLGLLAALGRVSRRNWIRQIATFYTEIIRGLPTLVLMLWIAFVGFPLLVSLVNGLGNWLQGIGLSHSTIQYMVELKNRDVDSALRVIVALTISYSAFIAEIFRGGIESIDRGQMEAARALGMTHWQAMRHIILRQTLRRVLPPLGNDLVAMLKDSSLVSALGVADITNAGRLYAAQAFKVIPVYNVVAFLYLIMTLLLSMGVRWLEKRMARDLQKFS